MGEAEILYRTLTDRVTVTREVWDGVRWVHELAYENLACALSRAMQASTPKLYDQQAEIPEPEGRLNLFLPAGTVLRAGDKAIVTREKQVFEGICGPSLPYPSYAVATLYLQEVKAL